MIERYKENERILCRVIDIMILLIPGRRQKKIPWDSIPTRERPDRESLLFNRRKGSPGSAGSEEDWSPTLGDYGDQLGEPPRL